jgi:hypothetical protein
MHFFAQNCRPADSPHKMFHENRVGKISMVGTLEGGLATLKGIRKLQYGTESCEFNAYKYAFRVFNFHSLRGRGYQRGEAYNLQSYCSVSR